MEDSPLPMKLGGNELIRLVSGPTDISEDDTFGAAIGLVRGDFNVSVYGDFAGTVSLQRSFDNGTTWLTAEQYTVPTEKIASNVEPGTHWRLGVESGNLSDGTVTVRIGQ